MELPNLLSFMCFRLQQRWKKCQQYVLVLHKWVILRILTKSPRGGHPNFFFLARSHVWNQSLLVLSKKCNFLAFQYVFFSLKKLRLFFGDFEGIVFLLLEAAVISQHRVAAPFRNRPDEIQQLRKFQKARSLRKIRRPFEVFYKDGLVSFQLQNFRKSLENKKCGKIPQESREKKRLVTWTLWAPYFVDLLIFFSKS